VERILPRDDTCVQHKRVRRAQLGHMRPDAEDVARVNYAHSRPGRLKVTGSDLKFI